MTRWAIILLAAAMAGAACDGTRKTTGSSADAGEREAVALRAYLEAKSAPLPEKTDLLRRVVALYDDLPLSSDAWFDLVFYLRLDPRERGPGAAFAAARMFAERKPEDARVSECFKLVAQDLLAGDDPALSELVFAAWDAWLLPRVDRPGAFRNGLMRDRTLGLLLRRRWSDAERSLASYLETGELLVGERVSALVQLGDVRGQRLHDEIAAREAWWSALGLAPDPDEAVRLRSASADIVLTHLVAGPLRALNVVRFRVGNVSG